MCFEKYVCIGLYSQNGDGFVESAVAITVTVNGKTLIGHLECIKNSIALVSN